MAREPSFALYESVFRASAHLSRRARGAYLLALCEYYFDGVQPTFGEKKPTDLPRDAMNVFRGVEYRIQRARLKASEGSGSQGDGQSEPSGPLPNAYQQPTDAVAGPVGDGQNMPSPAQTTSPHADVHTDEHTTGWGWGLGGGLGLGQKHNVALSTERGHPLSSLPFEEKLEAAEKFVIDRDYAAICTSYDALEKWVERWHENGWVDAHGDSMDAPIRSKVTGETLPRWAVMLEGYALGMEERAGDEW